MSLLRRLWLRLLEPDERPHPGQDPHEPFGQAEQRDPPPDPLQLCELGSQQPDPEMPDEERRLVALVEGLAEQRDPPSLPRLIKLVDAVIAARRTERVIELLRRLVVQLPEMPQLQLRLAELLYQRGEIEEAVALLERLADDTPCAARASFLLGEHCAREAELQRALDHFEAVLAIDFDYPRARARAEDLRSRLDRGPVIAAPTIIGGDQARVGDRFVLERELGRGGGGNVYLAHDRELRRPVAVKVIHPRVARRADLRTHLFCEARIAASLPHPHIVTIYDLDERLDLVAMEYCPGGTLRELIRSRPCPPDRALRRAAQMASVLSAVHRAGVVHRDLKPANWLLRRPAAGDDTPLVLTDFGIAHAVVDSSEEHVAGSRAYMAPEQRAGAPADPTMDLYASGVILIEMLLGRPALARSEALQGVLPAQQHQLWEDLRRALPGRVGAEIIELLRALVAPRPDARPGEAAELAERCSELAAACEARARQAGIAEQLQRIAGPPPRAPEIDRWLAEALDPPER